jgi:hypothetical protein
MFLQCEIGKHVIAFAEVGRRDFRCGKNFFSRPFHEVVILIQIKPVIVQEKNLGYLPRFFVFGYKRGNVFVGGLEECFEVLFPP